MTDYRENMRNKQRIVVKIGSSSLHHPETGEFDFIKVEKLVRELCDLKNQGKDVVLVTSGAIAVGKKAVKPYKGQDAGATPLAYKQACAAVGQARLMMTYQKIFSEYNQIVAQILMTKNTIVDNQNRFNAHNTFMELLKMGVIPIVNENDTIATYEINYAKDDSEKLIGDNDTLSAIVSTIIDADLLIVLSDIDGLYTDNPRENPDAVFIEYVEKIDDDIMKMGKDTESSVGTGGMATKLSAAKLASAAGTDMVLANGHDFRIIHEIIEGESVGTVFVADPKDKAYVLDCIEHI